MESIEVKKRSWAGIIVSALPVLLLLMDAVGKLVKPEPVVKATVDLGYSESVILPLGVVLLVSTILYAIPRTAIFGAVLITAYLGGAVATHVRISNPLFSHVLVPVYLGILLWLGLWLRNPRLRALVPFRR